MSVHVSSRVWKHSQQRGTRRLLVLALAEFANAEGIAWPSIRTLAEHLNEPERHTKRLLRQVEEDGEIASKPGGGRGHTTMYAVLVGLSEQEQHALNSVLQNTVIRNSVPQNTVLQGGNSVLQGQETVSYRSKTVSYRSESKRPNRASKRAKTAKNDEGIRHGSVIHDPDGSVSERAEPKNTPSAPAQPAASPAIELLKQTYPKLKPSQEQQAAITVTVTDLERWRYVLRLWKESEWRPVVGNLLDRYRKECANEQGSSAAPHRAGRLPGNVSPTSERAGHSAIGVPPPPGTRVPKSWELQERFDKRRREAEAERAAAAAARAQVA